MAKKKKKKAFFFQHNFGTHKYLSFTFKYSPFQTVFCFFFLTASLKRHSLPWLLALSFHLTAVILACPFSLPIAKEEKKNEEIVNIKEK